MGGSSPPPAGPLPGGHPNIIALHEYLPGEAPDDLYLVFDFVNTTLLIVLQLTGLRPGQARNLPGGPPPSPAPALGLEGPDSPPPAGRSALARPSPPEQTRFFLTPRRPIFSPHSSLGAVRRVYFPSHSDRTLAVRVAGSTLWGNRDSFAGRHGPQGR